MPTLGHSLVQNRFFPRYVKTHLLPEIIGLVRERLQTDSPGEPATETRLPRASACWLPMSSSFSSQRGGSVPDRAHAEMMAATVAARLPLPVTGDPNGPSGCSLPESGLTSSQPRAVWSRGAGGEAVAPSPAHVSALAAERQCAPCGAPCPSCLHAPLLLESTPLSSEPPAHHCTPPTQPGQPDRGPCSQPFPLPVTGFEKGLARCFRERTGGQGLTCRSPLAATLWP